MMVPGYFPSHNHFYSIVDHFLANIIVAFLKNITIPKIRLRHAVASRRRRSRSNGSGKRRAWLAWPSQFDQRSVHICHILCQIIWNNHMYGRISTPDGYRNLSVPLTAQPPDRKPLRKAESLIILAARLIKMVPEMFGWFVSSPLPPVNEQGSTVRDLRSHKGLTS